MGKEIKLTCGTIQGTRWNIQLRGSHCILEVVLETKIIEMKDMTLSQKGLKGL